MHNRVVRCVISLEVVRFVGVLRCTSIVRCGGVASVEVPSGSKVCKCSEVQRYNEVFGEVHSCSEVQRYT